MNDPITFSPGPSQLYPTVPGHLAAAVESGILSASHRSAAFQDLYAQTVADLRRLMNIPGDYQVWFMGSATEAMERIIQNTVVASSHHLIAGAFATRFATQAKGLGRQITVTEAGPTDSFNLDTVQIPDSAELVAITQNETSTGTHIPPAAISRLHERYPELLIAVDIVSSAPYADIDFTATDCAFFSVQKGFGLPAGLGVLVASPRALARAEALKAEGIAIGNFHSFPELAKNGSKNQTSETPNVLAIYLLGAVARDLLSYGLHRLRHDLAAQAGTLYAYLDQSPHYNMDIPETHRSPTVIVAAPAAGPRHVMDALSAHGIKLGSGYGPQKDTHIRIANFPAHLGHTDRLIGALDKLAEARQNA